MFEIIGVAVSAIVGVGALVWGVNYVRIAINGGEDVEHRATTAPTSAHVAKPKKGEPLRRAG